MKNQEYGISDRPRQGMHNIRGYHAGFGNPLRYRPGEECGICEKCGAYGRARKVEALAAYKSARMNGDACDNPPEPFPDDGNYKWEGDEHFGCAVRYTAGPRGRAWMEATDWNYLTRLARGDIRNAVEQTDAREQRDHPAFKAERIHQAIQSSGIGNFLVARFSRYEPSRAVMPTEEAGPPLPHGAIFPKERWCAVYIWHSTQRNGRYCSATESFTRHGSVGHAAMQVGSQYMSFWPARRPPGMVAGALGTHASFHDHYEDDVRDEGREADAKVVFYSLDIERINQAFADFKNSRKSKRWTVLGRNIFNWFNKGRGQSCSGLVYHLLKCGGISFKLHYKKEFERDSLYVTPNSIYRMISDAKLSELARSPITRTYVTPFISNIKGVNLDLLPQSSPSQPSSSLQLALSLQIGMSVSLERWPRAYLQKRADDFWQARDNINLLAYEIDPSLAERLFTSDAIFPDLGWQRSELQQRAFMSQQSEASKQFLDISHFYQIDEENIATGAAVLRAVVQRTANDAAGNEFVLRFLNRACDWLLEYEPPSEKAVREEKERKIALEETAEAERLSVLSLELFNMAKQATINSAEAEKVQGLVKSGADLSIVDDSAASCGWNALHWAVYLGHENIVFYITEYLQTLPYNLRKQQIDARTAGPYLGGLFFCNGHQSALHILTQQAKYDDSKKTRIATLLLRSGADRDALDYHRNPAIGNIHIGEEEIRVVSRVSKS